MGAASGNITTPLAALRAALPGAEVSWDALTADKFSSKNAKADAKRCEVSSWSVACVLFRTPACCVQVPEALLRSSGILADSTLHCLKVLHRAMVSLRCRRQMCVCCSLAAACRA